MIEAFKTGGKNEKYTENLCRYRIMFGRNRFRENENKVLRKIFGTRRDENIAASCFICRPFARLQSDRDERDISTTHYGKHEIRKRYWVVSRKDERTLRRSTCKREDDIKMDLKHTGYKDVNWIKMAHDRVL
jgi:hypothetical protein